MNPWSSPPRGAKLTAVLDLDLLRRHRLARVPWLQLVVANLGLFLDYRIPRRTHIVMEGMDNVPGDRGVFLAMNHTDRYNYWPFQYWRYRRGQRFTATWVKGKYVDKAVQGRFLLASNNIPVPSRGFVIAREFARVTGRAPDEAEYRAARDLVDGPRGPDVRLAADASPALVAFARGERGEPAFLAEFDAVFAAMMHEVIRLNREALEELDLDVLVFPEGTRSLHLSRGHTGLVQMAMHLRHPIVPVGCSGSDRLYPGGSPFSRGGRVTYRVGSPLEIEGPELAPFAVPASVLPFSPEADRWADRYRAATDLVMSRIDELLDPEYRARGDAASDGVAGVRRFL